MKHLYQRFQSTKTRFIYHETGPDRGSETKSATPQSTEIPDLGQFNGVTLDPQDFPHPEGQQIADLTDQVEGMMGEVQHPSAFESRLQGQSQRLGVNGENLTDLVGQSGLENNNAGLDGLVTGIEDFLGGIDLETATPADFIQALFDSLHEAGIETGDAQNNPAVQQASAGLGASTGAYDIPAGSPASSAELADVAQTLQALNDAGISLQSSGAGSNEDGTSRASNRTCLIGLRESTLSGAIALQQAAGESLVCTGGTEEGHANGEMSHYNGYKLDFSPSAGLIQLTGLTGLGQRRTMTIGGQRMDFYRHAPDHFDVKFYPA